MPMTHMGGCCGAEEAGMSVEPPAFDGDDEDGSSGSSSSSEGEDDVGDADPAARARAVAAAMRSGGAAGSKRSSTFGTGPFVRFGRGALHRRPRLQTAIHWSSCRTALVLIVPLGLQLQPHLHAAKPCCLAEPCSPCSR